MDDRWRTCNRGAKSYINTLSSEVGEEVEDGLTKAEASEKIEELQEKTGRGL